MIVTDISIIINIPTIQHNLFAQTGTLGIFIVFSSALAARTGLMVTKSLQTENLSKK
jgi:hypothetical protein